MACDRVEGESLGARHKNLNRLVNEAVQAETPFEEIANIPETSDVVRIFKISVAAKYKNLDYILENLKCDDLLYVSTAINKATWLITDERYSHLINPTYLNENVYPVMLTKAVNKFNLAIRLHLKDDARVEKFFNYYKENGSVGIAAKWLKYCSREFKRQIVKEHGAVMDIAVLKVLCEDDAEIFQILVSIEEFSRATLLTKFRHILFKDRKLCKDILESNKNHISFHQFGRKATKFLIQHYFETIIISSLETYKSKFKWDKVMAMIPQATAREFILSNWDKEFYRLQNATKFLTKEDMKLKILETIETENFEEYDELKTLINVLPITERFPIVQKYIIDNELSVLQIRGMSEEDLLSWYSYAPFDTAFTDLTQMIKTSKDHMTRIDILIVLVKKAKNNEKHILTVLKYFLRMHINEPTHVREMFLKKIVTATKTHKFEQQTWELLNVLFNNLEIFKKDNIHQFSYCIIPIIVYNLLHNLDIPNDMIDFFDSHILSGIGGLQDKLDDRERDIVFEFHLKRANLPILSSPFYDKNSLKEKNDDELIRISNAIEKKIYVLSLWGKDLLDYPELILLMRELLLRKNETKSKARIYIPQSRKVRRLLFDVLLLIDCNENTLLYTLKHNANLIEEYKETLSHVLVDRTNYKKTSCTNRRRKGNRKGRNKNPKKQLLEYFLNKTRVFFADDLAKTFLSLYLSALDGSTEAETGHKSIAHGVCLLMDRDNFEKTIQRYIPVNHKINWGEEKIGLLNIRKYFAQFLCKVRPMINVDVITKFANGDYLQWVKSSLESYLSTIPQVKFVEVNSILIQGPISLKKLCLRFAHNRFSKDEMLVLFDQTWTELKNANIRAILFTKLKKSLEKETEEDHMVKQWQLLKKMLDELTQNEEKRVYEEFPKFENLPEYAKADYFITGFKLLKSLPEKRKCASILNDCIQNSLELINVVDDSFFIDLASEQFDERISYLRYHNRSSNHTVAIITSLLIKSLTEDSLKSRYEKIVPRVFDTIKEIWKQQDVNDAKPDESKYKVLKYLVDLLDTIIHDCLGPYDKPPVDMTYVFEETINQIISFWKPEAFFDTIVRLELGIAHFKSLKESNKVKEIFLTSFCVCVDNLNEKYRILYTNEIKQNLRSIIARHINRFPFEDIFYIANHFTKDTSNINGILLAMAITANFDGRDGKQSKELEELKALIKKSKDNKVIRLMFLLRFKTEIDTMT